MAKQKPFMRSKAYLNAVQQQAVEWERSAPTIAAEARDWADRVDLAEAEAQAAPAIAEARREALTRFVRLQYHGVTSRAFAELANVPDSNRSRYQRHYTIAKAVNDDVPAPTGGVGVDAWRPTFEAMSLRGLTAYITGYRKGQKPEPTLHALACKAFDSIVQRARALESIPESGKRDWCIANLTEVLAATIDPTADERLSLEAAHALLDVQRADDATEEPADDETAEPAEPIAG